MIKHEAIVLRAIEYKDHKRVIVLLSKELGLFSLLVKHINHKNLKLHSLSTPLYRCEYILTQKKQDFYTLVDGHVLDTYVELRASFLQLKVALDILRLTERSQMPATASPLLYQLLAGYLNALKTAKNPSVLWASYALKLLKHEGLYDATVMSKTLNLLANVKKYEELHDQIISTEEISMIEDCLCKNFGIQTKTSYDP